MQPQRKHAKHSIVSNAVTRGQLRNNIVQWHDQAEATRALRQLPLPAPAPQESDDTDSPLPAMLVAVLLGLAFWALFGWGVIALIDVARSSL
jgi:hypothetical protein